LRRILISKILMLLLSAVFLFSCSTNQASTDAVNSPVAETVITESVMGLSAEDLMVNEIDELRSCIGVLVDVISRHQHGEHDGTTNTSADDYTDLPTISRSYSFGDQLPVSGEIDESICASALLTRQ
jgi:hypothetical protein